MKKFGLVGYPLTHTFSPRYFAAKFKKEQIPDACYSAYEIPDLQDLNKLILKEELSGFNVTIPHKQTVIPYLDVIDSAAAEINAVNCVVVDKGKFIGYNTDYSAFMQTIAPLISHNQKALIFGTGGSSLAIKYALQQLGIAYQLVGRNTRNTLAYAEIDEHCIAQFEILINTTPLGMHPDVESTVEIPFHAITKRHICYDLVYNPSETLFLQKGKMQGALVKNGLEMLELQADKSWEIWHNR